MDSLWVLNFLAGGGEEERLLAEPLAVEEEEDSTMGLFTLEIYVFPLNFGISFREISCCTVKVFFKKNKNSPDDGIGYCFFKN